MLGFFKINKLQSDRVCRLLTEGSWIVCGQILMLIGSFLLVRVLTDRLDSAQYGRLALGLTISGLVTQVISGGVISGFSRYYSIAKEKLSIKSFFHSVKRLMIFCTSAIIFIGVLLLVVLYFLKYSDLYFLVISIIFFSILSSYQSTFNSIQNAARQRAIVTIHNSMNSWLKIALVILFISCFGFENNSTNVVLCYSLALVIVLSSQFFFSKRLLVNQNTNINNQIKWENKIWIYAWPISIAGIFNWGYYASQRWALELFVSTSDVGKFYALTQISYTPISLAGGMFLSFLSPIFFNISGDAENVDRLKRVQILIFSISLLGLIGTFIIAFVGFLLKEIIFNIFVSLQYRSYSIYMPFVIIAAGVLQVSIMCSTVLAVIKKTSALLPLSIIGNLLIAGMNMFFTKKWGIDGLVGSMVGGSILHLSWMLAITVRVNK